MGVVYRAHDPKLERDVAVKLIRARRKGFACAHERLLEEAKTLAGVSHPNVVEVYDTGSFDVADVFGAGEGAGVFMVMAYVEGQTLQDWLRRSRRWQDVLRPFIAAGEGLAAIHRAKLVHRDFKPSNVLMGRPVRVVDFGLAAAEIGPGSGDPVVAGTPEYMAPEQFDGQYSPKSDQYSFCASLWKALYGTAVPSVEDRAAQMWRPPPNSRVPRWLHALVERGLEVDPEARHPDMRALLSGLPGKSKRRAGWGAALAGIGIAATTGFFAGQDIDPRCVGAPLEGGWDSAASTELRAKFLASDLAFAPSAFDDVQRYMDRFVGEWEEVRGQVCALEPSETREEALACLQGKELSAMGLLEVYADPDPILIERASSSLEDLLSPSTCVATSPKTRPPMEPSADLERAIVFFALGRNEKAREAIERAERETDDPRMRARLTRYRCHLAGDEGENETAVEVCTKAWKEAEGAGLNGVAARMLLVLAQHRDDEDYERAWEALSIAEAKIASMESATALQLRATAVRAELLAKREPARAAELFQANIGAKEAFYGSSTTRTVHDRIKLAGLFEDLGRFDEASAAYGVAQARVEERLGPRHPHIAAILNNRGTMELIIGRYDEAQEHLTDALELKLATPGWNTKRAASTHANLARLFDVLGDERRAEENARAAIAVSGAKPSGYVSAILARVLRHAGREKEALAVVTAAWGRPSSRTDADLAAEWALAQTTAGEAAAARELLADLGSGKQAWPAAEEPAARAALAQVELALGNVEAALEAERMASAAFDRRQAYPGEWATSCAEMAAALETVAPERAHELRVRARGLFTEHAPRRALEARL